MSSISDIDPLHRNEAVLDGESRGGERYENEFRRKCSSSLHSCHLRIIARPRTRGPTGTVRGKLREEKINKIKLSYAQP